MSPGRLAVEHRRTITIFDTVYVDEDTWAATNADMYDAQDKMWRVSESYNINFYDHKLNYFWGDAHMDIISGRYACVNSFYNIGIKDGNGPPVFDGERSGNG